VEHRPDRELEARLGPFVANDGQALAVGAPVGHRHVLEELAGRSPGEGDAGQGPRDAAEIGAAQDDGHLTGRGDAGNVALRQLQRSNLRAPQPCGEEPVVAPLHDRTVDDRLAVRCEARFRDAAAAERDLLEYGLGLPRSAQEHAGEGESAAEHDPGDEEHERTARSRTDPPVFARRAARAGGQ
jgi:hypothetical protein